MTLSGWWYRCTLPVSTEERRSFGRAPALLGAHPLPGRARSSCVDIGRAGRPAGHHFAPTHPPGDTRPRLATIALPGTSSLSRVNRFGQLPNNSGAWDPTGTRGVPVPSPQASALEFTQLGARIRGVLGTHRRE